MKKKQGMNILLSENRLYIIGINIFDKNSHIQIHKSNDKPRELLECKN